MNPNPAGATIVVGVDGSASSIEALRFAAKLAPSMNAHIHAITCWHFPYMYAGLVEAADVRRYEDAARQNLDEALKKAFDGGQAPEVKTSVLNSTAASALIDRSRNAEMLVLGRRGHGGFGGLQLGSVSTACVAHATCPVLVVHGDGKQHAKG